MNRFFSWFFHFSGLAAIIVIWSTVLLGMHLTGLGLFDDRPLSYIGTNPSTQTIFTTGLISSAVLVMCFGWYVYRTFRANKVFLVFLIIGQVGQIVSALAPNQGTTRIIHTIFAFGIVFSLPILMWQFAKSQPAGSWKQSCYRLLYAEIISFVVGMGLFTLSKGVGPLGEALPAIAFHVWIYWLTQKK